MAQSGTLVPSFCGSPLMSRVFVLINNTGIGGSERRLGRLFTLMVGADPEAMLIINSGLWEKLVAAGVVTNQEGRVWRLPEPWGRLAGGAGLRQGGPPVRPGQTGLPFFRPWGPGAPRGGPRAPFPPGPGAERRRPVLPG